MKLKPVKRIPVFIALGVILLVSLCRLLRVEFLERIERVTYDMRTRQALRFPLPAATNLGFVAIDDATIDFVRTNNTLGYNFDLYWPRQVYGRLVEELADQRARAVAFDVFFTHRRPDHAPVEMADGRLVESDEFFGLQMRRAGNVILGVPTNTLPPAIFRTNALALGDASSDKDPDGIMRRAPAFKYYRHWHWAFRRIEADPEYGVDLSEAIVQPRQIILPRHGGENANVLPDIVVPLDAEGNFVVTDLWEDKSLEGKSSKARPFTQERIWQMGIMLAAQQLKLDLERAEVDLPHGRITLRGQGGLQRIIPVDAQGYFYIDWSLPPNNTNLTQQAALDLLRQNHARLAGATNGLAELWRDKLVVIGSSAMGNDLTDWGATPLSTPRQPNSLLAGTHWNAANSLLTGRFVRRAPLAVDLALIAIMGIIAAVMTSQLRVLLASLFVLLLSLAWVAVCISTYVQTRYWLPVVLPVLGALLMTHVCLVTWLAVFEQAERRRVKAIFSTLVSPKIMDELLQAKTLSLGGARRQVTVLFADVRGFTELTDTSQERVEEFIRENNLTGAEAEACRDKQAQETLEVVNTYLGLVAEIILKHDATLDKFIGDCVMAFWGAPTPNPQHALCCVRAAIAAQRAIYQLNLQRAEENRRREIENQARQSAGLPVKPLLPTLLLGSGINTGMVTVGLMGSEARTEISGTQKEGWRRIIRAARNFLARRFGKRAPSANQPPSPSPEQQNYTVFGREVNLASRLESASGRGRIFIGETTYQHLQRDDPALAATCVLLDAQKLKGFSRAVTAYEVPWRPADNPPVIEELSASRATEAVIMQLKNPLTPALSPSDGARETFRPRRKQ